LGALDHVDGEMRSLIDLGLEGFQAGPPDEPLEHVGKIVTGVWVADKDYLAGALRQRLAGE